MKMARVEFDLNIKKIIYKIRDIEESVRNKAAHNITCITAESIYNQKRKHPWIYSKCYVIWLNMQA